MIESALPGDLVVRVRVEPSEDFVRKGSDLEYGLAVSFLEALGGFSRNLTHLDGRGIPISKAGSS